MAAIYCFGPFELRPGGTLLRAGRIVDLPPKQGGLLQILADATGRIVPKHEILDRLWPEEDVSEASLTTCVRGLRVALGDLGRRGGWLETVYGRGYRFHATVRPMPEAPDVRATRARRGRALRVSGRHASLLRRGAGRRSVGRARSLAWQRHPLASPAAMRSGQDRDPHTLARRLGLDVLVTGRIWSSATEVRVTVELANVATRRSVWSATFGSTLSASGLLAAEIAEAIAKQLLADAGAAW